MKANLSQDLALKLAPKENYLTEELVGILQTEFQLFISNWKRFDLYFPSLKPKKEFVFLNESKSQSKFVPEVRSQWKLLHWGTGRYLLNFIQRFGRREVKNELGFLALAMENRSQISFSLLKNTSYTSCWRSCYWISKITSSSIIVT